MNVNKFYVKHLPIMTMDMGVLVDKRTYPPRRTVGTGVNEKTSFVMDLKPECL